MIPLHYEEVHLWWTRVPLAPADGWEAWRLPMLSSAERSQHRRFRFHKDQRRYLATRALVRTVLSGYAPCRPEEWGFAANAHGRPHLVAPAPWAQRMHFNVSHDDALVVMVVTSGRTVGVDTESLDRDAPLEIAECYFSRPEFEALDRLAKDDRPQRFWELWTFKESYIKARGQGLSIPLDRFSIALEDPRHADLHVDAELDDREGPWRLWQYRIDRHLVALCIRDMPPGALRLRLREIDDSLQWQVRTHPLSRTPSPRLPSDR